MHRAAAIVLTLLALGMTQAACGYPRNAYTLVASGYGTSATLTPTITPTPTTTPPSPTHSPMPTPAPRSHNGIAEGDAITGELTHYCVCTICCGKDDGITASGRVIANGMDDPYIVSCNWLPISAVVSVEGTEYVVADRGGRGLDRVGRLDVYTPEGHQAALELGRRRGVEIIIVSLPEDERQ